MLVRQNPQFFQILTYIYKGWNSIKTLTQAAGP